MYYNCTKTKGRNQNEEVEGGIVAVYTKKEVAPLGAISEEEEGVGDPLIAVTSDVHCLTET